MNLSFMFDKETILNHEINQKKSSISIRIFLEFRNHLRIARTLITKKAIHEVFATLQKKSSDEEITDPKKIKEILESKIRESIVFMWSKALIQWMLLFDRETSIDWMKIEERND
jgi:hypothetical protein